MMQAQIYKKRPIEVEAVRYSGINADMIILWSKDAVMRADDPLFDYLLIKTFEGTMRVERGDWIVRGIMQEYYPVKNEIFEITYEPVIT